MSFHTELLHSVQLLLPRTSHAQLPGTSRLAASYPATMTNARSDKQAKIEKLFILIFGVAALISEFISIVIRRENGSSKAGDIFFKLGIVLIVLMFSSLVLGKQDPEKVSVVHSKEWFLYLACMFWFPQTTMFLVFDFYPWPFAFGTILTTYCVVRWLIPNQFRNIGPHQSRKRPLRIREQAVNKDSSE